MTETDKRYEKAVGTAQILENTNQLKLSLLLNYACYKYEVEQNFEAAIDIASTAFNDALTLFQTLDPIDQEVTLKVMILLEDNIVLFKKADELQRKKAQQVEFDEEKLALLRKGFADEDLVSLADSSIVSYDDFL